MSYELFIAKRYLRARRKTGFINSYISILGVTIGVAVLTIVLSVMNGFEEEVRSRIVGFDTHIRLRKWHFEPVEAYREILKDIEGIPHIVGAAPYISEKGLLRNIKGGKHSDAAMVRGADPENITKVTDLGNNIVDGKLDFRHNEYKNNSALAGMLVGRYLADRLYLSVGDTALLVSLTGFQSMFSYPPMQQFVITGIFETGFFEFDNTYLYVDNLAAQRLFKYGDAVQGIEIKLDNLYAARSVADQIEDKVGFPFTAETWFELRQNLFSWIQMEKIFMFIILCLIIIVAASNIISTLIMLVIEKTREIGILKSMGATHQSIQRIFLLEGVVVGALGTLLGNLVGFSLCWAQQTYKFIRIPGDVYFISEFPVKMVWTDFALISLASVVLCLVAAIYPAFKASQLDPIDAIRYE